MLFSAEITDFRIIHNVLKAITMKDYVILRPMAEGLKLTLDEMKCVETSVYIPNSFFTNYNVDKSEEIIFKISLKVLVDILNIFGDEGSPSFKLSYAHVGAPLCIIMNHIEENITIDCEIRTMNVDDFDDVSLAGGCDVNKLVIKADILTELLNRLNNSADELSIKLSPDPPYFTLSATGIAGKSEVSISKNSDAVTLFQCQKTTTAVYYFNNIRTVLKVMAYADKVGISTGDSGLLGLQLVITSDDKQMYVEYYVTSQYLAD
ncbi:cell cycle checkpoint protein RAD1-like [Diorhabda sublineata]|uniref:cell cycle checkpoint protein RAD1-like n=1 Tax=Diorhabda sublineata TaxID=1163346 RepID=UPI0024E14285|nr:cell cycle checkpoint protein RAD1-like [Diorhabda sublineata]